MSDDPITRDYLDDRIDKLKGHILSRLDRLETNIQNEHRRDIDRIEKKSNLQDIAVFMGTIVAAVLGIMGIGK